MSATIVTIRGRACSRRRNRAEDAKTIQLRRLIEATEREAFEDGNATALAVSWAMARNLPRNNLRMIAGTLDIRKDLEVRIADVEIVRTERAAVDARWSRVVALQGVEAAQAMRDDSERLLERLWLATVDLANTPAFTRADLRRKRQAIGSVWLSADGARYEPLRAAVAEDEARLRASK